MRLRFVAMLLGALCAIPTVARADSFDPISVGPSASTLGFGVTLERPLLFNLSARIATGLMSTSSLRTYDNNPWQSTFHQNNVLVAMDWRPYAGRWRLSGGLLFGGDYVQKVAQSFGPNYTLNGNVYPVNQAGVVSARVSFARPALYAGFGGGTGIVKGLTLAFDAGIVVRNGTTSTSATGPLQANPQFQADLSATAAQFRTRLIQPVIGIGLVYRP
ncbi:MAG TPA: hypothetical protein VGP41_09025 [Candidatus Lustribacter sp.]|jgi:hypothetical protein|nr:hypothetical protein [Candidatus Lustribacter sp.]